MKKLLRKIANRLSLATEASPHLHRWLKAAFLALPTSIRGRQMIWDALCELATQRPKLTLLQVGANDGDFNDPVAQLIRRHGWSGVLVEPVPFIFERLQANYLGQPGIILANVAVSDHDGTQDFYYLDVRQGNLPTWCIGVGSFIRDDVVKACPPANRVEDFLRTLSVPCRTIGTLLSEHQLIAPDLIVIDAQGYDAKILLQLPLDLIRPQIIIFEHHLLSAEELESCRKLLQDHDYRLQSDKWDTLATLN